MGTGGRCPSGKPRWLLIDDAEFFTDESGLCTSTGGNSGRLFLQTRWTVHRPINNQLAPWARNHSEEGT